MVKLLIILSLITNLFGLNFRSEAINQQLTQALRANTSTAKVIAAKELPPIVKLPVKRNAKLNPQILAQNYILVEQDSNEILASRSEDSLVPIASTTKITTATVVLENYQLNDVVIISSKAASQIGSDANLIAGEKMTVLDLMYCMLLKSGNDAAYALAEHYQGGVEAFVKLMNDKALSLNMKGSHYLDPAGLNPGGRSSAYDLSIITRFALKNPTFAKIVATSEITITDIIGLRNHDLKNSNRLVNDFNYPGAIGVKTGYLPGSGHCLVGAAKRNGHILIAVILNTNYDTPTASAEEARKLLDYGFNNFEF